MTLCENVAEKPPPNASASTLRGGLEARAEAAGELRPEVRRSGAHRAGHAEDLSRERARAANVRCEHRRITI